MSYDHPSDPAPHTAPPQQYPTVSYPAYGPQYYPPPRPLNGCAVASLVVSALAVMSCLILFSPVGAVLGHIAHKQIAARNEQGFGLATAGIIVGWIGTAVLLLIAAVSLLPLVGVLTWV